jgi:hypothetical protein
MISNIGFHSKSNGVSEIRISESVLTRRAIPDPEASKNETGALASVVVSKKIHKKLKIILKLEISP